MAITLSEKQQKLLQDKNFAYIGTVGEDGGPQVTPVWVDFDGSHIIFNTEKKRAKTRNLAQDPRISVTIADAANPYYYIEVRGRVVEITEAGGSESIEKLSWKYLGKPYPFAKPDDVRVIVKVEPLKVLGMG